MEEAYKHGHTINLKHSWHSGPGKEIEYNFYFVKRASSCHNFSNLLSWLGEGSKPVREVKYDSHRNSSVWEMLLPSYTLRGIYFTVVQHRTVGVFSTTLFLLFCYKQ